MWTTSANVQNIIFLSPLSSVKTNYHANQNNSSTNPQNTHKCWVSFPPITTASPGRQHPCSRLASWTSLFLSSEFD